MLDRATHAVSSEPLGGRSIADLVGLAPEDRVAREIAANRTDPVSLVARSPLYEDDSLRNAVVTADIVRGARLQPPTFGKPWAALEEAEIDTVERLGLEEESWDERFEHDWPSLGSLSDEQHALASALGYTEPKLWPPRPCDTADAIEQHFVDAVLLRFLKCRDVKGIPTTKRPKAEMIVQMLQEEAELEAKGDDN
eukprot:SAG11_NODE_322_length_10757_cov_2.841809_8_plen_196_part_00